MRAKAKLRKSKYQQELQSLRDKMAMDQMKANKIGDISTCTKGKLEIEYRVLYCDKNFPDDFINNRDCKSDEFCYMCCEQEFGNFHLDRRELCYNMCDFKEEKIIKKEKVKDSSASTTPYMWS